MNLVPGTASSDGVAFEGGVLPVAASTLPVAEGDVEAAGVVYGIRPEYVDVTGPGDGLEGTVTVTENLGTQFLVTVEIGGVQLRATVPEGDEPQPGDRVGLAPDARRALLYDAATGSLLG